MAKLLKLDFTKNFGKKSLSNRIQESGARIQY